MVSGNERQAKDPERGRVAVVADHSTVEGREVRPKRPTGGKEKPGRASAGRNQGRDLERTTPDTRKPVDCGVRGSAPLAGEQKLCARALSRL
jgi:hypothetical protein